MNFNLERHNLKALAIVVGDSTEPVKSEIDLEGGEIGGPSQRMGEPGPGGRCSERCGVPPRAGLSGSPGPLRVGWPLARAVADASWAGTRP